MTGDHGQKISAQAIGTRQKEEKIASRRISIDLRCFCSSSLSSRRLQGEGNAQKKLDKRPVKCFWMSRARRGATQKMLRSPFLVCLFVVFVSLVFNLIIIKRPAISAHKNRCGPGESIEFRGYLKNSGSTCEAI
jgi:hypothetical protein